VKFTIIFLLAGLWSLALQAAVTATVDRTSMTEFEILTLSVRVKDVSVGDSPDFSPIEEYFEIVGAPQTSTSRSISIVNGRQAMESTTTYQLSLRPKREGRLWIPPFTVAGERTSAIPIDVVPPSAATRQRNAQFVFFDTSVDTDTAYVQSQIIYTVKLFYADSIAGDFPPPPTLSDAVIETIEDEKRDEAIVDNRRYYVLEKRYAIFPQKSGVLSIPSEVFRGTRGRGGLFGQRQSVSAVSPSIDVSVKPKPASFSGSTWIAAKSLNLVERWTQQPPVFKVGEPVNRVLSMQATGLAGSLLPPFAEQVVDGLKTYADPPVTDERASDDGLVSSSVTTVGMVPTKAGDITLPEIHIPWWNTVSDQEEIAIIPASTYSVLPADGVEANAPTVTVPLTQITQPQMPEQPVTQVWMYAALVLGLLWLYSTFQWLVSRRALRLQQQTPGEPEYSFEVVAPNEDALFRSFSAACKSGNAADAHRELFLWCNARFGAASLQALRQQVDEPELDREIEHLESVLFGRGAGDAWSGGNLLSLVKSLRNRKTVSVKKHDLVSELNPA
jgi:hypothetical protein